MASALIGLLLLPGSAFADNCGCAEKDPTYASYEYGWISPNLCCVRGTGSGCVLEPAACPSEAAPTAATAVESPTQTSSPAPFSRGCRDTWDREIDCNSDSAYSTQSGYDVPSSSTDDSGEIYSQFSSYAASPAAPTVLVGTEVKHEKFWRPKVFPGNNKRWSPNLKGFCTETTYERTCYTDQFTEDDYQTSSGRYWCTDWKKTQSVRESTAVECAKKFAYAPLDTYIVWE